MGLLILHHSLHLHVFMGICKHVSSMVGNFTSISLKNHFWAALLFLVLFLRHYLNKKKTHSFESLSVFGMVREALPKQSMPLIGWLPWTLFSLVLRACRHSQHLQGDIPWLQNSGQNWRCKMVITVWTGDRSFAFLVLDSRDFCAVLSTLTEPRKRTPHSGWMG